MPMSAWDLLLLYGDSRKSCLAGCGRACREFLMQILSSSNCRNTKWCAVAQEGSSVEVSDFILPLVLCLSHPELREAAMSSWSVGC